MIQEYLLKKKKLDDHPPPERKETNSNLIEVISNYVEMVNHKLDHDEEDVMEPLTKLGSKKSSNQYSRKGSTTSVTSMDGPKG